MSMIVGSSRKRRRESCKLKQARCIADRSRRTTLGCVDYGEHGFGKGDSIDLFSLLFSKSKDFLITNNNSKVKADELRGKAILIYMVSLELHEPDALLSETFHLREAYDELRPTGCFKVVLVPVGRGRGRSEDRFNACFSYMPWPAVPLYDKPACDRLERAFHGSPSEQHSYWCMVDPMGKFLLNKWYPNHPFITYYGGLELVPFTDNERMESLKSITTDTDPAIKGIIHLDQLLASHCRDFLLTNDNTKVPISSHEGKVVGLYFCGCVPDPPRMEAIKKVYQQAVDLGHDFEIVQINFHFHYYTSPPYTYIIYDSVLQDKPLLY